MNTTAIAPQTIYGDGMYIFRELEINAKMDVRTKDDELELYRYIRRELSNHVLVSEKDFDNVLRELKARVDAINLQRMGTGNYLHIDGVLPTDHTIGWITITYLDVRRARACITIENHKGEIGGDGKISGDGLFIFQKMEINNKMNSLAKDDELELYRYIRRELSNHVLVSEKDFDNVLRELKARVDAINLQRTETGDYLYIDGVLPTDHTKGWIKLGYTKSINGSSYIVIVNNKGKIKPQSCTRV